ncbi:MAG: YCF48-related protein [Ignavibacteriaceae bacterium]
MMNSKILISVLFSFFIFSSVSLTQPQWYEQNSGLNRELTDVCFVDQNNGWISGWTETMLHTTDGGATWTPQNILPNNAYYSVYFTDLLNGWATGYAGKIVHTTDGGETWVDQTAPITTEYYESYFINSDIGWLAGGDVGGFPSYISHRVILYTSNGGATWIEQYGEAYESPLKSIYFVDQNNGYAAGESGIIMKTTNGGINWSQQVISSFHFRNIFFIDNLTGWVTGY